MKNYIAFLRQDVGSDVGVDFPDVPGCISAGATVEEAMAMAAEALAGHLAILEERGDPIPEPSALHALSGRAAAEGAIACVIEIPDDFLKSERINVMLPKPLLRRIDAAVGDARGRSRFLSEAAEARLSNH